MAATLPEPVFVGDPTAVSQGRAQDLLVTTKLVRGRLAVAAGCAYSMLPIGGALSFLVFLIWKVDLKAQL
jgi:hypothetical protein